MDFNYIVAPAIVVLALVLVGIDGIQCDSPLLLSPSTSR
jgi:hypothetical protein